jgi:CheY-like chemotaxis protein
MAKEIHMLSLALSHEIFTPDDLAIVREIFDRVSAEPWFTSEEDKREEFARYVVRMYARGLVLPDRLESMCRVVARKRFDKFAGISGRRILLVEDEYISAWEAVERLTELGAEVVGPVGNVGEAMELVEAENAQLDAALLDIALGGQMVYPVAAFLKMNHIPFAFVTGYEDRQVPAFYRSVPTFPKPADWGLIASTIPARAFHVLTEA